MLLCLSSCSGHSQAIDMDEEARRQAIQEVAQERQPAGSVTPEDASFEGASTGRTPPAPTSQSLSLQSIDVHPPTDPQVHATPSVTLRAGGLPLGLALDRLAAQVDWTVRWGEGTSTDPPISANISDVPFHLAAETLASQAGFTTEPDFSGHTLTVRNYLQRVYYVPEIWATRPMPLPGVQTENDLFRYVQDPATGVENTVRGFLSPEGKALVDPIHGTVLVRDHHHHVRILDQYFRNLAAQARSPWLVDIAILVTSPGESGVDWDRAAEQLGLPSGAPHGPAAIASGLPTGGEDPLPPLLTALKHEKVRLVSRPTFEALNGWTVRLASSSGPDSGGSGWEIALTVHRDHDRPGTVLVELSGAASDDLSQRISATAQTEIGRPLILSTGAASTTGKGWLGGDRHTQETLFVVRVLQ